LRTLLFTILTLLFLCSNSNALDCDKAFLNHTVYRMCETEEAMIQQETEDIKRKRDNFTKTIFEDASKLNLRQDLETALASKNKSPGEEYLINKFIRKNKALLDEINYQEWKLTASKDEIEAIMTRYFEKYGPKKK